MRELFILIILPLLVIAVRCSNVEDNFNLFKDRMRTARRDSLKNDLVIKKFWDTFAPLQGFEYSNIPVLLPENRKRAINLFKKRMMNNLVDLGGRLEKRTSKAALSLMLQSKQDPDELEEGSSCFAGK